MYPNRASISVEAFVLCPERGDGSHKGRQVNNLRGSHSAAAPLPYSTCTSDIGVDICRGGRCYFVP